MFAALALGVLGGFGVGRILGRHRCDRHGAARAWRFHHGRARRGRRLFWILRDLGLDAHQKDEVQAVWLKLREVAGRARFEGMRALSEACDAASTEPFDRTKLDDLVRNQVELHGQLGRDTVDAVARLYEGLRPDQRDKLRALLSQFIGRRPADEDVGGIDQGPYRS